MPSTGKFDGPAEITCQVEGCNRKIKTTLGKLRQGTTLRRSAGHKTVVDGRHLDRDLRDFERNPLTFR